MNTNPNKIVYGENSMTAIMRFIESSKVKKDLIIKIAGPLNIKSFLKLVNAEVNIISDKPCLLTSNPNETDANTLKILGNIFAQTKGTLSIDLSDIATQHGSIVNQAIAKIKDNRDLENLSIKMHVDYNIHDNILQTIISNHNEKLKSLDLSQCAFSNNYSMLDLTKNVIALEFFCNFEQFTPPCSMTAPSFRDPIKAYVKDIKNFQNEREKILETSSEVKNKLKTFQGLIEVELINDIFKKKELTNDTSKKEKLINDTSTEKKQFITKNEEFIKENEELLECYKHLEALLEFIKRDNQDNKKQESLHKHRDNFQRSLKQYTNKTTNKSLSKDAKEIWETLNNANTLNAIWDNLHLSLYDKKKETIIKKFLIKIKNIDFIDIVKKIETNNAINMHFVDTILKPFFEKTIKKEGEKKEGEKQVALSLKKTCLLTVAEFMETQDLKNLINKFLTSQDQNNAQQQVDLDQNNAEQQYEDNPNTENLHNELAGDCENPS